MRELLFQPDLRYASRTVLYAGTDIIGEIDDRGADARVRFKAAPKFSGYEEFPTLDEAKAFLVRSAPAQIAVLEEVERAEAEFNALPADLQELVSAANAAHFEMERAWGRDPFNPEDWKAKEAAYHQALTAQNAAMAARRMARAA